MLFFNQGGCSDSNMGSAGLQAVRKRRRFVEKRTYDPGDQQAERNGEPVQCAG